MIDTRYKIHHKCPWCGKGEVLADGRGKVILSIQCPRCTRFFTADLDNLKVEKSTAQKRERHLK